MKAWSFNMHLEGDDAISLADALERQIEAQSEAAKTAIREYKKAIRSDSGSRAGRQIKTRRDVEHAVNQYMQLRRQLDELRLQMSARPVPPRVG
jgi:hypothetical protein